MSWTPEVRSSSPTPKTKKILVTLPSTSTGKSGPMTIDATTPPRPTQKQQEALSEASDLEITQELFGSSDSTDYSCESDDLFTPDFDCVDSRELYPPTLAFVPWLSNQEKKKLAELREKEEEPKTLFELSPLEYDNTYDHEAPCAFCGSYFCAPCAECDCCECKCGAIPSDDFKPSCFACNSYPCVCPSNWSDTDGESDQNQYPAWSDSEMDPPSEPEDSDDEAPPTPYPTPPSTPVYMPIRQPDEDTDSDRYDSSSSDEEIEDEYQAQTTNREFSPLFPRRGGVPQGRSRDKRQATSRVLRRLDGSVREFGRWIDLSSPRDVEAYLTFLRDWLRRLRLPATKSALIDFVDSWACHPHRKAAIQVLAMNRCGPRPKLFARILAGDRGFDYDDWRANSDREPQMLDELSALVQIFMYVMLAASAVFISSKFSNSNVQKLLGTVVVDATSKAKDTPIMQAFTSVSEAFNSFTAWVKWARDKILDAMGVLPPLAQTFLKGFAQILAVVCALATAHVLMRKFFSAILESCTSVLGLVVKPIAWIFTTQKKKKEADIPRGGEVQMDRPKSCLHSIMEFIGHNLVGVPAATFFSVVGVLPKIHSVGRALEWIFSSLPKICNWAMETWSGVPSPTSALEQRILQCHKQIINFDVKLKGSMSERFHASTQVLVDAILLEREAINEQICKVKDIRPYFTHMFSIDQGLFQRNYVEYKRMLSLAPPRQPPVWVYLFGKPGCGKTTSMVPIASRVWTYVQTYQNPDKPIVPPGRPFDFNQIYGWIDEDPFKDNYQGQFCVSNDELFQTKVAEARNQAAMSYMRICTTAPCPVPVANPPDKGITYFVSPLLITTSNLETSFHSENLQIQKPEALEERRSFVAEISSPDPEDLSQFSAKLYAPATSPFQGTTGQQYVPERVVDFETFCSMIGEMILQNQKYAKLPEPTPPPPRFTGEYHHFRSHIEALGADDGTEKEKIRDDPTPHQVGTKLEMLASEGLPPSMSLQDGDPGPIHDRRRDEHVASVVERYGVDSELIDQLRMYVLASYGHTDHSLRDHLEVVAHVSYVLEQCRANPRFEKLIERTPMPVMAALIGPPAFGIARHVFYEYELTAMYRDEEAYYARIFYPDRLLRHFPNWLLYRMFKHFPVQTLPRFCFDTTLTGRRFDAMLNRLFYPGHVPPESFQRVGDAVRDFRNRNFDSLPELYDRSRLSWNSSLLLGGCVAVAGVALATLVSLLLPAKAYKKRKPQMEYPGSGAGRSQRALNRKLTKEHKSVAPGLKGASPPARPSKADGQGLHDVRFGLLARAADWVSSRIVDEGTAWEDAPQRPNGSSFCLWIRDTTVLMPTHIYKAFARVGYDAFLSFTKSSDITVRLKDCEVKEIEGDISLVTLPPTTINQRRDITGLFCQEIPKRPKIVHVEPSRTDASYHLHDASSYTGELCYSDLENGYTFFTDLTLEGVPNYSGMCGTCYCDASSGEIIAIHMAGTESTDTSYASMITRSIVSAPARPPTVEDLKRGGELPQCAFHDQFPYTGNTPFWIPGVRCENKVSAKLAGFVSAETKLRLSAFKFTEFPVPETTFSPVALKEGRDEDGNLQSPLVNALAKYGRQSCVPMDLPPVDFSSWFPKTMRPHRAGPCSMEEAVFGIPGFMKSIDFTTSPGLYFKKRGFNSRRELCFDAAGRPDRKSVV